MKSHSSPSARPAASPPHGAPVEEFWAGSPPRTKKARSASKDRRTRTGRIILAEDDTELRKLLAAALREDGHDVIEMHDGYALLDAIADLVHQRGSLRDLDLIVSDIRLPGLTGLHALAEIRTIREAPPVILITAFGDERTHRTAEALGAVTLLDKPFDVEDLREEVSRQLMR